MSKRTPPVVVIEVEATPWCLGWWEAETPAHEIVVGGLGRIDRISWTWETGSNAPGWVRLVRFKNGRVALRRSHRAIRAAFHLKSFNESPPRWVGRTT